MDRNGGRGKLRVPVTLSPVKGSRHSAGKRC